jgi:hypothetical protein
MRRRWYVLMRRLCVTVMVIAPLSLGGVCLAEAAGASVAPPDSTTPQPPAPSQTERTDAHQGVITPPPTGDAATLPDAGDKTAPILRYPVGRPAEGVGDRAPAGFGSQPSGSVAILRVLCCAATASTQYRARRAWFGRFRSSAWVRV